MAIVINFVIDNYIWFMIGVILILFAIIGRYADKTNFGEGKKIVKVKKKKNDLIDSLEVNHENGQNLDKNDNLTNNSSNASSVDSNSIEKTNNENISKTDAVNEVSLDTLDLPNDKTKETTDNEKSIIDEIVEENRVEKEQINELLPDKDVLDDDLFQDLGDMSDISFSPKKSKLDDIPDLDDVSLPNITASKKSNKEIWKKNKT